MAPSAPKGRAPMRSNSRGTKLGSTRKSSGPNIPQSEASFSNSKKDKRMIRHSILVNRIQKAHSKPAKQRRPNTKLITTLESLGEALPEVIQNPIEAGKIKQISVKTRPGAMKRKQKAERSEVKRFGQNMAQLAIGTKRDEDVMSKMDLEDQTHTNSTDTNARMNSDETAAFAPPTTAVRWAALRTFIEQTMEQKEEFEKGGRSKAIIPK